MKLSKRLSGLKNMVPRGLCAADIGADRGELSYTLLEENICPRVILSDVSKYSLNRAVTLFDQRDDGRLKSRAEFRVGDGLRILKPGEVPTVIMAGMGGLTICKILADSPEITEHTEHFIIQAMGNTDAVRQKLYQAGFYLSEEDLIYEEGFYYPLLHAVKADKTNNKNMELPAEELKFGPLLLKNRHPLLKPCLEADKAKAEALLRELAAANQGERRQQELKQETALLERVLAKLQ